MLKNKATGVWELPYNKVERLTSVYEYLDRGYEVEAEIFNSGYEGMVMYIGGFQQLT